MALGSSQELKVRAPGEVGMVKTAFSLTPSCQNIHKGVQVSPHLPKRNISCKLKHEKFHVIHN